MRGKLARTFAVVLGAGCLLGLANLAGAANRGADGEFEERRSSHFVLFQDVDIDEI